MEQNVGEVAAVAEESSASTEEVSASTEETSASAQQIAASAHELAGNAEALNELVHQFKLKSQSRATPTQSERPRDASRLRNVTLENHPSSTRHLQSVRAYALPIAHVHEIIRYTQPRSVASADTWVRGVINSAERSYHY